MRADRISLTLTYAVTAVGLGAALLHISLPWALLLLPVMALGGYWDFRDKHALSARVINLLAVMGVLTAFALPGPGGAMGRLLSAAVVLLAAKLLAPKEPRDHMQIILLSLVLLIGAAMLTVDMNFAVLFLLFILLAVAALAWLPFYSHLGDRRVKRETVIRVGKVAVGIVAASLPLVLVFFVALPRTSLPLWQGAAPVSAGVSGFSDRVQLGDVGKIAQSTEVAFRAQLRDSEGPLTEAPYWRGLVFEETDGLLWTRRPFTATASTSPPSAGEETVRHTVYLEPHGRKTLFALDRPATLESSSSRTRLGEANLLEASREVNGRIRYTIVSRTGTPPDTSIDPPRRERNLHVPAGLPEIVGQRAAEATQGLSDPYQKAQAILRHFHEGEYRYTRAAPQGEGHPLQVFLGRTKTGYCEYFASAMVLMLREEGIPARMVGGYLGGTYNENGNYYLVRQESAHTWVEVYLEGRGWLRMDPTPPSQGPAATPDTASGAAGRSLMFMDALRLRWYASVIGYDLEKQTELLSSVAAAFTGGLSGSGRDALVGATATAVLLLATSAVILLRRRKDERTPAQEAYASLLRRLKRRGFERSSTEGPLDFAERTSQAYPEEAVTIRSITNAYVRSRYAGREPSPERIKELKKRLRDL